MDNRQKENQLFPLKGFFAIALIKFIYWLPRTFSRRLSQFINRLIFFLSAKKRHIVLTNLKIAFPSLDHEEISVLAKNSMKQNGKLLPEFLVAWFGDRQQIENEISDIGGREIIDQFMANGDPVIIAAPHIGNWELMGQWIQINYPMVALYASSKIPQIDQLVFNARSRFGGKLYSTDSKGILNLLRSLRKGKLTVVLPDQVPKQGSGIYVPFFGKPAYTMTLLNKFVQKSKAQLVFGYCVPRDNHQGFDIKFERPTFDSFESDPAIFNLAMNRQIEAIIKRYPEQYVWDYKRFKLQPDGHNPYAKNKKLAD